MKLIYLIILILSSHCLFAQNDTFIGFGYGSSDIFRQDDSSHYNYKNTEFSVFVEKNFDWKSNPENRIKKYWILQPKLSFGAYEFYADNTTEQIFRTDVSAGIKFVKEFQSLSAHAKVNLSSGYQSGYHQRLAAGVFFTERINFGIEFQGIRQIRTFVDIGAMHISNANFHRLNRGLEVFFIEVGFKIM